MAVYLLIDEELFSQGSPFFYSFSNSTNAKEILPFHLQCRILIVLLVLLVEKFHSIAGILPGIIEFKVTSNLTSHIIYFYSNGWGGRDEEESE